MGARTCAKTVHDYLVAYGWPKTLEAKPGELAEEMIVWIAGVILKAEEKRGTDRPVFHSATRLRRHFAHVRVTRCGILQLSISNWAPSNSPSRCPRPGKVTIPLEIKDAFAARKNVDLSE